MPESSYQVVFKAGYEVRAKDKEEAKAKARRELEEELRTTGTRDFVVDVEKLGE